MPRPVNRITVASVLIGLVASQAIAQPPPKHDAYGDPLPPGALVRIGTLRWRAGTPYASALSRDGRSIYVAGSEAIRVFDLETGKLLRSIPGIEGSSQALAVSPDERILASAGYKGAFLWDAASGKKLRQLKIGSVAVMAFSPDGTKLVTGGEDFDRSVRIIDVETGKEELRLLWHRRRISLVAIAPDGKTLVSACGWDNDIRVTDLATGDEVRRFHQKYAHDTVAALSPDGKTLAVADARYQQRQPRSFNTLRLIDVATGKERSLLDTSKLDTSKQDVKEPKAGSDRIHAILFTPDGKSLVASSEGKAWVWDVAAGTLLREMSGADRPLLRPGAAIRSHFAPDGRRLISAGSVIRVWDFESGKELHPPEGPLSHADSISYSPDGGTLAVCSFADRGIHLWDTTTAKLRGTLRGHESYIRAVQFAPDGRLISGGGDSAALRIWDVKTGKDVFEFKLHEPRAGEKPLQVCTMGLSRDGKTLAAAAVGFEGLSGKERVHVFAWNLSNGKLLTMRETSGHFAEWPGFSPDGARMIATADKGLAILDLVTGKPVMTLEPAPQPGGPGVLNANILESPFVFSPDGRLAVVRGSRQRKEGPRYWRDKYAYVLFDLETGKEMRRIFVDDWRSPAVFSPDSRRLAGADGRSIRIWDVATGKETWRSPELDYRPHALAFSPDGGRLATSLGNATTLIWDVQSK